MITAWQKARELYDKTFDVSYMTSYPAKQACLIWVDELIKQLDDPDQITYWKEVKQEIEKL